MRPPCEIIVAAVLPAIRSLLARELVENLSLSQVEAAELLGTTQPAISQYLGQKRGDQLIQALSAVPEVKAAIKQVVADITSEDNSKNDAVATICSVCMTLRRDGSICELHQARADIPDECEMCQTLPE